MKTMINQPWILALLLLSGCAHYQPLYQNPQLSETTHRIMLTHVQDENVSELGRILSELLSNRYSQHEAPSHLLEAKLKDVTILTSPVQPGTSSLRSYSIRASLALSLKNLESAKQYRTTLRETADFLLAARDSQEQVLKTEHNRQKALNRLAHALTARIERFIALELANTEYKQAKSGASSP